MIAHSDCYQDLLPIPSEWENVSYSNDLCSSFWNKKLGYSLYVNPLNVKDREDKSLLRFTLVPIKYETDEEEWHRAIAFDDISNIRVGLTFSLLWNNTEEINLLTREVS